MWPPSSPTRTNSAARPSVETYSSRNQALKPNALPVFRLQARQWHTAMRVGSPEQVAESWPHEHSARRVVIVGSYTFVWQSRKKRLHTICRGLGTLALPRVVSFRRKLFYWEARIARFEAGRCMGRADSCPYPIRSTSSPAGSG